MTTYEITRINDNGSHTPLFYDWYIALRDIGRCSVSLNNVVDIGLFRALAQLPYDVEFSMMELINRPELIGTMLQSRTYITVALTGEDALAVALQDTSVHIRVLSEFNLANSRMKRTYRLDKATGVLYTSSTPESEYHPAALLVSRSSP